MGHFSSFFYTLVSTNILNVLIIIANDFEKNSDKYFNAAIFCSISVWYIFMEPFAGGLASLLILSIYIKSGQFVNAGVSIYGLPVWQAALAIHVVAWIIQFIGHGVFEGIHMKLHYLFVLVKI